MEMVSEAGWTEEFLQNPNCFPDILRERELHPSVDTFIRIAQIKVQTVPVGTMVTMGYAPCHNWALPLTD